MASWDDALRDYQRKRLTADQFELSDLRGDSAEDNAGHAARFLIEAVRAPSIGALATKLVIGRAQFAGFELPDETWVALTADAERLAGA